MALDIYLLYMRFLPLTRKVELDYANPEKVISAFPGTYFYRSGNDLFYLINKGVHQRIDLKKRSFTLAYQNQPWFPTVKNEDIVFSESHELWIKKGGGNNTIGWEFVSNNRLSANEIVVTPSPSNTSATPEPTLTPTPTPTLSATLTPTPTTTGTPTLTPTPTLTVTQTPSATPSLTPTDTPTSTPTNTPTTTPTPSSTSGLGSTIVANSVSQSDVKAALAVAVSGDTVIIPSGSATWTSATGAVGVGEGVTLQGSGVDVTIITVGSDSGPYTTGICYLNGANSTVKDFTVNGSGGARSVFIAQASNFRISNIKYNGVAGEGYFCYGANVYGLIDSCNITGGGGDSELIFTRGPSDSWDTPTTLGTDDAIYIEDCTFGGSGYVCDFNSDSRGVVRYCTIDGRFKIDAHGLASNTPATSARLLEAYRNTYISSEQYYAAFDIRGGTGITFDNRITTKDWWGYVWFIYQEYGARAQWPNFENTYQTPVNYPVGYQVGTGQRITINATEIVAHQMVKIKTVGTTDYTLIGADNNNVGTQFISTGPATGTGTVTTTPASEPFYHINNTIMDGTDWSPTWTSIPTEAVDLYKAQTGNAGATFEMTDIIAENRNLFRHVPGAAFNGSGGVGRGTKSQMEAIVATLNNVGFWVTDEGTWNNSGTGEQGRLYRWNGSSWTLYYEPYTYPHPRRS